LGDSNLCVTNGNTLKVKEILKIYLTEQMIYPNLIKMSDTSITVNFHDMSLNVLNQSDTFITVIYHDMSLTVLYQSDTSITMIYHDMSLTVLYLCVSTLVDLK
jgi:hypothetical protein